VPYRGIGLPVVWSIATLRRATGSASTVPANTTTSTVIKVRSSYSRHFAIRRSATSYVIKGA
jgi:hypothetical protein